jgi:molybdenum cofactor synthesis domain-containing protein
MISLKEAIKEIKHLREKYYFNRQSEEVSLEDALGRELATPITAGADFPPADLAGMDGFALCSKDEYPLRITGRCYAGDRKGSITRGEAVAITTGAFMPEGADAVLKIEDARVEGGLLYGKKLQRFENVVPAGSDYRKGEVVLEKHRRLTPQSVALLYSLDVERVPVYPRITVGIVSTGTEIWNNTIKNTTAVFLRCFLHQLGCRVCEVVVVPDERETIKNAILQTAEKYDVVFTTGGVSVGERDYVAGIIEELGELVFHRVKIRPGKPLAVGIVEDTPVFALPGKPTGAITAVEVVVRRYFTETPPPSMEVVFSEDVMLPEEGFNYIVYTNKGGTRVGEYVIPVISSTLRSSVVEGYVISERSIRKNSTHRMYLLR